MLQKIKICMKASVQGEQKSPNLSRCWVFLLTGAADVFSLVSLSASEVNLVYGPPRAGMRSLRQMYGALRGEPAQLTDFPIAGRHRNPLQPSVWHWRNPLYDRQDQSIR